MRLGKRTIPLGCLKYIFPVPAWNSFPKTFLFQLFETSVMPDVFLTLLVFTFLSPHSFLTALGAAAVPSEASCPDSHQQPEERQPRSKVPVPSSKTPKLPFQTPSRGTS